MQSSSSFAFVLKDCVKRSIAIGLGFSLLCCLLVLAGNGEAQANELPGADPRQAHVSNPSELNAAGLVFKQSRGYLATPTLHTDVQIFITGMIARTRIIQSFKNTTDEWQEAVYVFPLPESAAVDELRMVVGERKIVGEIREKQQARKQYEQARSAGKRASLLEQQRPNIFTTSIANIGPREKIKVEIEYQQIVDYQQAEFSLRLPTVVAPRYIPGKQVITGFNGDGWARNTTEVTDASRITPHVIHPDSGKRNEISISVDLEAGFEVANIKSLYHKVNVERIGDEKPGAYRIDLSGGADIANRDFVLNWFPVNADTPSAAMFRETVNGEEYAVLMITPPGSPQHNILQRETIFVIDTSGSMAGSSIRQAKSALQLALTQLRPGDSFNIIQFNSRTSQLFPSLTAFNPQSLSMARSYVASLEANGGTEIAPALRLALNQGGEQGNSVHRGIRQVIFLTDGSVGNEDALFQYIAGNIGTSRLFTIGIGSAPNSWFMRSAARLGRGTHTYIGDIGEVEEKMSALLEKLSNPVLGNISLDTQGALVEAWPAQVPDLYLGEPLLVTLKSNSLPRQLGLKGMLAGKPWQSNIGLDGGQQREGVAKLWARKKIEALMESSLKHTATENNRKEILETALEHQLVSKYTSLVAIDPGPAVRKEMPLTRKGLPVNLPAGWEYEKVFASMPATATPASLHFLLGISLALAGFFFRRVLLPN